MKNPFKQKHRILKKRWNNQQCPACRKSIRKPSEVKQNTSWDGAICVEGEIKCANCGFLLSCFSYSPPVTWWDQYLYDRWVAKENKELKNDQAE